MNTHALTLLPAPTIWFNTFTSWAVDVFVDKALWYKAEKATNASPQTMFLVGATIALQNDL